MSRFIAALLAATAMGVVGANAADLPMKAPPPLMPAVPVDNWTGFYAGIAGGYGWGRATQTDSTPFSSGSYKTSGGLIGGTLGYNWQAGPAVFGLETDLSWASISGSTVGTDPASGNCGAKHCESKIEAFGTLRGRLGYAWQNVMPYITGGLAYADLHGAEGNGGPPGAFGSGSSWVAGWTAGAGLEAKFTPNWSGKIEYLYADFGKNGVFTDTIPSFGRFTEKLNVTVQTIRVGLNYRF